MRLAIIYLFGSLFQLSAVKVLPNDVINVYESLHIQSFCMRTQKHRWMEKKVGKSLFFFGRNEMVRVVVRACKSGQFNMAVVEETCI